jgi:putative transposase
MSQADLTVSLPELPGPPAHYHVGCGVPCWKRRMRGTPVGTSWRMDETYIIVNGDWKYLYRAVDEQGRTVDFLLTAKPDAAAARRFFEKAMRHNTVPDKLTMDKNGANQAALEQLNKEREVPITIQQVKYLSNVVD